MEVPPCCSEQQVVLLVDWTCFLVTGLLLWHSRVLFPLKLFTVFLHEFSHACAVWLTCNKVTGIEVNAQLGGMTHWSASAERMKWAQLLVLPAGYIGSAFWGGVILVCCAAPLSAQVMALVLIGAFAVALGYACCGDSDGHRRYLALLSVFFIVLLVVLLWVSYCTTWPWRDFLLSTVLLLIGAMNTLFATYDIWEDCVARSIPQSDAYRLAQLTPCCAPRCIGALWLLLSLVMVVFMLGFALHRSEHGGARVRGLEDLSPLSWAFIGGGAACLVAALGFRFCCSAAYQASQRHRGVLLECDDGEDEGAELVDEGRATDSNSPSSASDSSEASSGEVQLTTGLHGAPPLAAGGP